MSGLGLPRGEDRHLCQGELLVLCPNAVPESDMALQRGVPPMSVVQDECRSDVIYSGFIRNEMEVSKTISKIF